MPGEVRAALRALLLADPAISAAVGGNRIWATLPLQGAVAPYILSTRISEFNDIASTGPTGLERPRFQLTAWGRNADEAANLADLIRDALHGYSGTVSYGNGSPVPSIVFRGIFMDVGRDLYDDISKLYGTSRDFLVWFADR
jgi:hypothetical protein